MNKLLRPFIVAVLAFAYSQAQAQDIAISEVHYIGTTEFIEIENLDTVSVDLTGWTILVDNISFSLTGVGTIAPGSRSVYDFPAGVDNIDDGGSELIINDNGGSRQFIVEMDNWTFPATALQYSAVYHNSSECLNSNDQRAWRPGGVIGGTPGSAEPAMSQPIFVNEIRVRSGDAIELYNPNNTAVDLSNWFLLKDLDDRQTLASFYTTVVNLTIPANGYLVLTNEPISDPGNGSVQPAPYSLASSGESLFLISPNGGVHGYFFTGFTSGDSVERYVDSAGAEHFVLQSGESFGRQNQLQDHFDDLVISEVHYNPSAAGGDTVEFVELANVSGSPVDLFVDQYRISNLSGAFGTYMSLTTATVLNPGDVITLAPATPDQFNTGTPLLSAGFTSTLSNTADFIELQKFEDNRWVTIDSICYQDDAPWDSSADGSTSSNGIGRSLQRLNAAYLGSDPANWSVREITPGTSRLVDSGDFTVCTSGSVQVDIGNIPSRSERIMVFQSNDLVNWFGPTFLAVDGNTNTATVNAAPSGRSFFRFGPAGDAQ